VAAGDGLTTARADDAGGAAVERSGGSSSAPAAGEGGGTAATAPPAGDGPLALAVPRDGGGAYASYLALLHRRVQEAMTYPAAARRRGLSGTVHLEIALEPSGVIRDVTLTRSSSHGVLDDAAVDAVRALRRVPFPPDVRARALRVRLPVVFELR
jgi:protein TonB